MNANGRFEIFFPDAAAACAAAKAMKHENLNKRSSGRVAVHGNRMVLTVEAADTVAFRATFNTYMRDLQVFESVEGNHIRGAKR